MYVLSCAHVFVTPWTVAHQAPLSMGPSRQEYWNGLPFPTPGDLSDPGILPVSLVSPALAGGFFTTEPPGKPKGGRTGRQTGGETRDHQRQYLPSCLPATGGGRAGPENLGAAGEAAYVTLVSRPQGCSQRQGARQQRHEGCLLPPHPQRDPWLQPLVPTSLPSTAVHPRNPIPQHGRGACDPSLHVPPLQWQSLQLSSGTRQKCLPPSAQGVPPAPAGRRGPRGASRDQGGRAGGTSGRQKC